MGGVAKAVGSIIGGGQKPADPAPLPAAPTSTADNTSAAVAAQAAQAAGRGANQSAGTDPALQDSTDPYSVKKKLLGA
jgi:hypothetical protein